MIKVAPASLLVGIVLVLSIAGCVQEPSPAADATRAPATAHPTSAPSEDSAEPSQSGPGIPPTTGDLTVTPTGMAPLVVGQPVPDAASVTELVTWNPTLCLSEGDAPVDPAVAPEPYTGAWQTAYSDAPLAYGGGTGEPFSLITADGLQGGAIAQMMVRGSEVSTEEGVAPGATRDDLEAAYPEFDSIVRGQASDVYVIRGADGGALWFEVANGVAEGDEYWDEGIVERVLWISIMPTDVEPRARSGGDSAGPCPQ